MIKITRLATEKEKSAVIAYITSSTLQEADSGFFVWSDTRTEEATQTYDWNLASFIVLEVKGMEDRIVIVNQVSNDSSEAFDITTGHYLLSTDNHVVDINY